MSFWASLQIHFLPFNLSVSSQPKIWISQNLWCNNLRRLNLLCCTDFGTWKGIKSTEIDKNILNWHNTEICQFLRNTPAFINPSPTLYDDRQAAEYSQYSNHFASCGQRAATKFLPNYHLVSCLGSGVWLRLRIL